MTLQSEISRIAQNCLCKCWGKFSDNVGNTLIHLGALGWLLSSAAQIKMIALNKNLDKKSKEFLIPQEFTDLVVNVGLYYAICMIGKKCADAAVEKGVIITQDTLDIIRSLNPEGKLKTFFPDINDAFATKGMLGRRPKPKETLTNFFNGTMAVLENTLNNQNKWQSNELLKKTFEPILRQNNLKNYQNTVSAAMDEFKNFKNGVGVFAAVAGSVISCNVITPISRNYTANFFQELSMKIDENKKYKMLNKFPTPRPIPRSFDKFKI